MCPFRTVPLQCYHVCLQSTTGWAQNTPIGAALGQSLSGTGVMWGKMCRCEPIGSPSPQAEHLMVQHQHPPACLLVHPVLLALRLGACTTTDRYQQWRFGSYHVA